MNRRRGRWVAPMLAVTVGIVAACSSFGSSDGSPTSPDADTPDTASETSTTPNAPEILATGQSAPYGITVDGTNVYFTNRTPSGSIVQCPKTGCGANPLVLASDQPDAYGIAVDETTVYWTSPTAGEIRGAPIGTAGAILVREAGAPTTLVLDSHYLYWIDPSGSGGPTVGSVESCLAKGCPSDTFNHIFIRGAVGLAVSGQNVFWTSTDNGGSIAKCPPCDTYNSAPFVVGQGVVYDHAVGLAVDDANLYVTARGANGVVLALPSTASLDAGEVPVTLAKDQVNPFAVKVDTNNVYFTTQGTSGHSDGTVMRVDKAGQNLSPLAVGQSSPAWLALDDDYVYWTNTTGGTVMRVRKTPPLSR